MKRWWMVKIAKAIVLIPVFVALFGFIVMGLWNALIPEIFHGPVLTFWQAVGLLLLSHLLLRGWMPWRHANGWHRERWRKRFEAKLAEMTPEERDKFKEEWEHRCGWSHSGSHEAQKNA